MLAAGTHRLPALRARGRAARRGPRRVRRQLRAAAADVRVRRHRLLRRARPGRQAARLPRDASATPDPSSPRASASPRRTRSSSTGRIAGSRQQHVDARTVIAVLTHDPKFDVPALTVALRTDAGYVGAMGSRRTHEDRLVRLKEAGLTDDELARLHSPIGLDLGARTPEETAISIAAEIVQARWGGSGAAPRRHRRPHPPRRPAVTRRLGPSHRSPGSSSPPVPATRYGQPKAPVVIDGERLVDRAVRVPARRRLRSGPRRPRRLGRGRAGRGRRRQRGLDGGHGLVRCGSASTRARTCTDVDRGRRDARRPAGPHARTPCAASSTPAPARRRDLRGERGHPVRLARAHWSDAIREQAQGDAGARRFLRGRDDIMLVEVGDVASGYDLDVPARDGPRHRRRRRGPHPPPRPADRHPDSGDRRGRRGRALLPAQERRYTAEQSEQRQHAGPESPSR